MIDKLLRRNFGARVVLGRGKGRDGGDARPPHGTMGGGPGENHLCRG